MTGQPFLRALLGPNAAIVFEAAFGADLSDVTGAGWVWTDLGSDPQHDPGVPITVGRADNVGAAGAARLSVKLNNSTGNYTYGNPVGAYYPNIKQNTPIRQRMTLDGTNFFTRFQGYMDSANPVTDQSAKVKWVSLTALGALGRLAGQKKPIASPLTRAILASKPTGYWPLDEPSGSTQAHSAIPGVQNLFTQIADPVFGAPGPGGAAAAVDMGQRNSGLQTSGPTTAPAVIPLPPSTATSFRVELSVLCPDVDTYIMPISVYMGGAGDIDNVGLQLSSTGINVHTTFADSSVRNDAATGDTNDGVWHRLRFDVAKSGADTTYVLKVDNTTVVSVTLAGKAFSQVSQIKFGSTVGTLSAGSRTAATALALWQPYAPPVAVDTVAASNGYAGENVQNRLTRLCAEEGINLVRFGFADDTTMGPQPIAAVLDILRECEAADHGILFDGFGPGLGYQCRSARYNATAAVTLDMGASPPQVAAIAPVFDRQAVKNLYQVSRKGGATATVEQVTGPMGTDTIGTEDAQATVNIDTDTRLAGHANWLVSLGTVPGFRFPTIGLNMLSIPSKAATVLGMAIGSRITVQNPASKAVDLPPDPIDLIVEGWTETTTADTWSLTLNCSPYAPDDIAVVNTSPGRIDAAATTTGTTWTTTVTGSKFMVMDVALAWTVAAGDFPLDINIGGERITVSAMAAWAGGGQNFTISARSVNGVVKAHAIGEAANVWTDLVIGL